MTGFIGLAPDKRLEDLAGSGLVCDRCWGDGVLDAVASAWFASERVRREMVFVHWHCPRCEVCFTEQMTVWEPGVIALFSEPDEGAFLDLADLGETE